MRAILLLALVGGCASDFDLEAIDAEEQPAIWNRTTDSTLLWRGFYHRWDYNHRINRLGNYLTMSCESDGCDGNSHHRANTGHTGADDAVYRTHYTEIQTSYAGFRVGNTEVRLSGTEGDTISGTRHVCVDAPDNMKNRDRYVALLNGFDLDNAGKERSKKLDFLRINISGLEYDPSNGKLDFDVHYVFKGDCDSDGCTSDNDVKYDLTMYWMLAAGDADEFRYTNQDMRNRYSWDGPGGSLRDRASADLDDYDEIFLSEQTQAVTIEGDSTTPSNYHAGTIGLRGFEIDLSKEYDMLTLSVRATGVDYLARANGSVTADIDVFFKNWTAGMTNIDDGAFGGQGRAIDMDAYLTMLQFKRAAITHRVVNGTVDSEDNPHDSRSIGF